MPSSHPGFVRLAVLAGLLAGATATLGLLVAPLPLLGEAPRSKHRPASIRAEPYLADAAKALDASGEERTGGGAGGVPRIRWRDSVALGAPEAGSLVRGVRFPARGRSFFTWDPILKRRPNRDWRRWGTDDLVRTTLRVLRQFAAAHPSAGRIGVGDLSRPEGADFGPQFGGIGHATHQNGLDVDVYYPRLDRRERPPSSVDQIDLALAQDLVDRFLAAGAVRVYVGPSTGLSGPPEVVIPLVNHDNHLHARLAG